jgi:site-specific DNA-methyltransferase (adenine-specific)/adenine-specific DNA-methyltransferase
VPRVSDNEILVGDSLELMKALPDGCARLVIADPPYNLGKDFGPWKERERASEWLGWSKLWLTECRRLLAPGGNIFVYGIHHHLCWIQCFMYELGLNYRRQIIWNYENGFAGYTRNLAAHYEPLLWFSKGDGYTFHSIREPYKSTARLKHKIIKNGKVWTPNPDGRMAGDVWRFPTLAGRRFKDEKVDHPTQKPLPLTQRIVKHFSNEGDLVVVPFLGSGTECVAAAMLGRIYWGADLNPEYVKIAKKRLKELSGPLFEGANQAGVAVSHRKGPA